MAYYSDSCMHLDITTIRNPRQAGVFIGCCSLGYFGLMCTETDPANWWNRMYLYSVALQQMALEAQEPDTLEVQLILS